MLMEHIHEFLMLLCLLGLKLLVLVHHFRPHFGIGITVFCWFIIISMPPRPSRSSSRS
jgi:hypothetical protein